MSFLSRLYYNYYITLLVNQQTKSSFLKLVSQDVTIRRIGLFSESAVVCQSFASDSGSKRHRKYVTMCNHHLFNSVQLAPTSLLQEKKKLEPIGDDRL